MVVKTDEYTEVVIKAKLVGSYEEVEEIATKIKVVADTKISPLLRVGVDKLKVTINDKGTYE